MQRFCRRQQANGGPTPSPPGAAAHFLELKDGDTVPTKVTVRFGLREMGVAPAGLDRPNSGHHHLLIDSDLPPLNEPIPNDFNHLHFGAGQTETQVTLKPGPHTLQLLLGDKDHIPHSPPVMSPRIRVIASDATTSPQVAAASVKKRRNAQPAAATIILLLPIAKIRDLVRIDARDDDHLSTRESVSFGRSPDWLKSKNPAAPTVKREAEKDCTATASSISEWLSFLQWLLLH